MRKIGSYMIADARILAERMLVPEGSRVRIETQQVARDREGYRRGRGGVTAHYSSAALHSATSFLSSSGRLPTSHEVMIFVDPDDMDYAVEHIDEYREELKKLAHWDTADFGLSLEEGQ